jgi:hypothetical protein
MYAKTFSAGITSKCRIGKTIAINLLKLAGYLRSKINK